MSEEDTPPVQGLGNTVNSANSGKEEIVARLMRQYPTVDYTLVPLFESTNNTVYHFKPVQSDDGHLPPTLQHGMIIKTNKHGPVFSRLEYLSLLKVSSLGRDAFPTPIAQIGDTLAMSYILGKSITEAFLVAPNKIHLIDSVFGHALPYMLNGLHQSGVVHRDIKPAHIIIDGKRVRLIDFDNAACDPHTALISGGSPSYCAPEMLEGVYSSGSDIYSLGIIALSLLVNSNATLPQTSDRIARKRDLPDLSQDGIDGIEARHVQAIKAATALDPSKRPTALRFREIFLGIASI